MLFRANNKIVLGVFLAALFVRVYNLNLPFVEPYNNISRQSMSATVVRNLYEKGFNLLYPEIDENGPGPYLYNVEMPIYALLMAVAYLVCGGVHEAAARSVSVFFSMAMLYALYRLISHLRGDKLALYALIFASFSPMSVALARSVQPDMTMVAAGTISLYWYCLYVDTANKRFFYSSALAMLLAILSKLTAFYLIIPITYLAWSRAGVAIFKEKKNYAYIAIIALSLIWYGAMWYAGRTEGLVYSPYDYLPDEQRGSFNYLELFTYSYSKLSVKVFCFHVLTAVGLCFFVVGLVAARKEASSRFFYVWLASVVFYILLFYPKIFIHPYYQLSAVPALAFFVARGADYAFSGSRHSPFLRNKIVLAVLSALVLVNLLYYYQGLYYIPERNQRVVEAGDRIRESTPAESLVVASFGGSPIQLYYAHRKGWAFNIKGDSAETLVRRLEDMRRKGAEYFVTTTLNELREAEEFNLYLRTRYDVIQEDDAFILVDLK